MNVRTDAFVPVPNVYENTKLTKGELKMGIENETQNPYSTTSDVVKPETENIKPGVATASLVLGIAGLCLSSILFGVLLRIVGLVLGIVGLALGIIAIVKKYSNKGMATAGITISAIVCVTFIGVFLHMNNIHLIKNNKRMFAEQDEIEEKVTDIVPYDYYMEFAFNKYWYHCAPYDQQAECYVFVPKDEINADITKSYYDAIKKIGKKHIGDKFYGRNPHYGIYFVLYDENYSKEELKEIYNSVYDVNRWYDTETRKNYDSYSTNVIWDGIDIHKILSTNKFSSIYIKSNIFFAEQFSIPNSIELWPEYNPKDESANSELMHYLTVCWDKNNYVRGLTDDGYNEEVDLQYYISSIEKILNEDDGWLDYKTRNSYIRRR